MSRARTRRNESGFALILAILALLLLTFLGLTLAATTSTELQIATNYRWAEQARYNAEAGLEVGRSLLTTIGDATLVLPPARAATWDPDTLSVPVPVSGRPGALFTRPDSEGQPSRNFENGDCDTWGNGAGYGAILDDGATAGAPFQNVSTVFGRTLNGTFTLWVRRKIDFAGGLNKDGEDAETVVLTSEGAAPYLAVDTDTTFAQTRRAVAVIEAEVGLSPGCSPSKAQDRQTGFAACDDLKPPGPAGP